MLTEQDQLKKLVGQEAAHYIKDGMKIGLGSGSTVYWMIKMLGERVKEGLHIEGIPSSNQTAEWAKEFGVPLTDFSKVEGLDVTIDGADEVDGNLNLVKGGGGALFREKVIAKAAKELIIIVDESKVVEKLGDFPLPVEVLPFGWEMTAAKIKELGCELTVRSKDNEVYVTDNGNYILDCQFGKIENPEMLDQELIQIVGVVETGLFTNMTDKVIVGSKDKVSLLERK
ncbi:ribose-5-phosphate isomerase RpiA [Oceanobacillus bengalensis]|uniref:Ribose-5-phosphate isomerase A n=1 Tax=Oceanobacillus bengalensis TaxID=1435466 RepID=A0A494Z266_9BACI|nr:ribose-5-phosphate isomerase RpiA [Oceanobacillus bengalensis]RKQ16575.1 ribose-5-phosphate isomerase RpiA [Oceanobacillus bengalensis]